MEERRALSDEARQPVCVGGVRAAGVEPAAPLRAAAARPEYCGAVSRLGGAIGSGVHACGRGVARTRCAGC